MLTKNNDRQTNADGDRTADGKEGNPSGRAIPVSSPSPPRPPPPPPPRTRPHLILIFKKQ